MKSERCRTDAEDAWADLREDSQLPGRTERVGAFAYLEKENFFPRRKRVIFRRAEYRLGVRFVIVAKLTNMR